MAEKQNNQGSVIGRHSDIVLAVGLTGILGALIIPLPTVMLDILLTLNFSYALLVMMIVLGISSPIELSTFPSLLLLGTLFRLGLNVASTRLILLQAHAGEVIEAFGGFVVGGELVIGLVVFAILVVIQFVVITKGADRISEVVARFTLDAMPGKQMSIDADLNAGLIEGDEARERRQDIVREAEFYGSMDGASKYIRGDAIAGIVIVFINLLGGIIIGISRGMAIGEALQTYASLTVGDGLVTQIPAVIMSTAAGILVTKSVSDEGLSTELGFQMFSNHRALAITAGAVFVFMLVPGLPVLPFLVLGVTLSGAATMVYRTEQEAEEMEEMAGGEEEQEAVESEDESIKALLSPDRIAVEIGFGLISLVDPDEGGTLIDRIRSLRKKFAREMGLLLPKMRIVDNMNLEGEQYRIQLSGHTVAEGIIYPERVMAMKTGAVSEEIEGIQSTEPSFGLPVVWVKPELKEKAMMAGYTAVDPESVLITHLSQVLRNNAHEILNREDVGELIDNLRRTQPGLVDSVVPDQVSIGLLQRVLEGLLKEGIPIRNMGAIVETCANRYQEAGGVEQLVELVRKTLKWAICDQFSDDESRLHAVTLDPAIEEELARGLRGEEPGEGLRSSRLREVGDEISSELQKHEAEGIEPVLLVSPELRMQLQELIGSLIPDVAVLAYDEICDAVDLQTVGIVTEQEINPPEEGDELNTERNGTDSQSV